VILSAIQAEESTQENETAAELAQAS